MATDPLPAPIGSAPVTPPPMRGGADVGPRKRWIWIGGSLMALGAVAFVGLLIYGFVDFFRELSGFERVAAGETSIIDLDRGDYLIFVEGYETSTVEIIGQSGLISLRPVTTASEITVDDFHGLARYSFETSESGPVTVNNLGTARIAIGPPFLGKIVRMVLLPFAVGGPLFAIGGIMLIVTLVKRSEARRLARQGYPRPQGP